MAAPKGLLSACVLSLMLFTVRGAPQIALQVAEDGNYTISWPNGTVWLRSAPPFFTVNNVTYSAADSTLTLLGVNQTVHLNEGYVSNDIYYSANGTLIVASILDFSAYNFLTFSVNFPLGANGTSMVSADEVICGFPGFHIDPAPARLAYMSYGDNLQRPAIGRWQNDSVLLYRGRLGSGPLVLFDKNNSAMVVGPSSSFGSASLWQDHQTSAVYWGIMGSVKLLHENFTYSVLLSAVQGVRDAVGVWAFTLASNFTKAAAETGHPAEPPASSVFGTLGYWTSLGSDYYTSPEVGRTYEDTLADVRRDANNDTGNWVPRLAYGYVELDTWWYQKGQAGDGVKTWVSDISKLPNGIMGVVNRTENWKVLASGGMWANDTTYAVQNGGQYAFLMGNACALPADTAFWSYLFRGAAADGVAAYIQYDMDKQFSCMTSAEFDLELVSKWLSQLYSGATENLVEVMYGPTIPRVLMETSFVLRQPAVVQVGSGSVKDANHWKVGLANIFVDALRLRPFFGAFKSYRNESDPATQLSPELYSLLATLTGGPVGIGDRVGTSNRTIITRCCDNFRGTIFPPSVPAKPIDAQLQQMAWEEGGATGEVWSTFTTTKFNSDSNNFFHGIIMATGMTSDFALTPTAAGLTFIQSGSEQVYQPRKIFAYHDFNLVHDFTDSTPFTLKNCTLQNFCLYHVAPVIIFRGKEVVIMGDMSKWVPMSPERIVRVDATDTAILVSVQGEPYEEVYLSFMVDGRIEGIAEQIKDDGKAVVKYEESPQNARSTAERGSAIIVCFCVFMYFVMKWRQSF
ncbi:uncharacterized protein LOC112575303 [Pomacea canaliculata]|uniref:uncharacterized protein LOC112575303 n=1 Tax=Pomacea canaliculata TaxID=400727 RepID=UPI000D738974|nr:uncharacterized protein LOC112575303 [Pomacea canaliculata]XP_025112846.1 uncharacterized protein LOC112575303 [Pomacea canaliculata]